MRVSSITKNAGKACNNRLYRHIRTFEKIIKNYFVIYNNMQKNVKNKGVDIGIQHQIGICIIKERLLFQSVLQIND